MNREKFREMYDLLMEQLDVSRELSDDEILGVIDELILTQARELFLSLKEKVELRQELFCSVRKLDVLCYRDHGKWSGSYFCGTWRKTDQME